uniref:Uncharacterized protein n=1 Tax=Panagrolaimus sp. PS1159 TaxID=55785 RepID=A0AC35GY31_9BILA
MTEFGFPIFYEYFFDDSKLKVNLIIANGRKTIIGNGKYYYVRLIDEEGKCGETRPKTQKDTLQGNYGTDFPIFIKPQNGLIIQSQVKDFIYPFFTIDPIFGTMAFLIKDDIEFAAIHYKINENNLTNFEKVFSISLPFKQAPWNYVYEFYNLILKNSDDDFVDSKYPSFTSYGKVTYIFFAYASRGGGFCGIWSPKKQPTSNLTKLHNDDSSRYLYFLDSDYFVNAEPVGKFIPQSPSESSSKCPEETSYLGAFIAFAIID